MRVLPAGVRRHTSSGVSLHMKYAVLRRRWPASAATLGLPFGVGFFLTVDELMNPLLRLTPRPQAFPWQTHARGPAGHVVFGVSNHLVLEGLDRVA